MLLNIIIALVVFYLTIVTTVYVLKLPYNSFLIGLLLIVVCLIAGSIQAFNGKTMIVGAFGKR
jgi:hypothetical protein